MKFNNEEIELSLRDRKRGLQLPRQSSRELAEFMGILTGDGYMNHYKKYFYMIEIAGHKIEDHQFLTDHVATLSKKLFNFSPTLYVRKDQDSIGLRFLSKGLFNFLLGAGFKAGRKDQIGVPDWIQANNAYMRAFVRGFADTDGSFHYRGPYPTVTLASISEALISEIFHFLQRYHFVVRNYYCERRLDKRTGNLSTLYRLRLNGEKNFEHWITLINFKNMKHLKKIKSGDAGI
tara:strand:- start:214 stop:915 length:702 start_codon:yes stop_codon:yes gene_type:complete